MTNVQASSSNVNVVNKSEEQPSAHVTQYRYGQSGMKATGPTFLGLLTHPGSCLLPLVIWHVDVNHICLGLLAETSRQPETTRHAAERSQVLSK